MGRHYVAFFLALFISFMLTPAVRKLAFKVGALDIPKDERKIHSKPMPYLGGLAIYAAVMIGMIIFLPMDKQNISIMAGATIMIIVGVYDDINDMPAKIKFLAQIVAAFVVVYYGGVKIAYLSNPFSDIGLTPFTDIIAIPLTMFWIVGITNTINVIDGLDGLASGVTTIAAATLLFTAALKGFTSIMIMCTLIAGASLGFLPFNFNPAKIFMGDTGALFLGYILAVTSVLGMMKSVAVVALVIPIFALGFPIFDTAFAIFRRLVNKKPIMEADKGHLHHRLLDKGLSQRQTVLILYFISMVLGVTAVFIADSEPSTGTIIIGIVTIVVLFTGNKFGLFGKKENQ